MGRTLKDVRSAGVRISVVASALLLVASFALLAQPMKIGYAVGTCWSGSQGSSTGYVMGVMDVRAADPMRTYTGLGNTWTGVNWMPPMWHDPRWTNANLGEIFGIALNDVGDIYVTATTVYDNPANQNAHCWDGSGGTSNPGGPGGYGGVYHISGVTGDITTVLGTLAQGALPAGDRSAMPNTGSGLGNIAYDPVHRQFFITNFEDGRIYRYDPASPGFQSVYDPFTLDGGTTGIAPLGERVWGVGVWNNRVYFAQWNQGAYYTSGPSNQIWSVGLTASGEFQAPETSVGSRIHIDSSRLEIIIPPMNDSTAVYSNAVSDIEFSASGAMLLGERTNWWDDPGPTCGMHTFAHGARVLHYLPDGSGGWIDNNHRLPGILRFGAGSGDRSAAGGVDYAYERWDTATDSPVDCDSAIWFSADALNYPEGFIYGFGRLPAAGGNRETTVMIDADSDPNAGDKTRIGDIDVYRRCVPIVDDPCDSLDISVIPAIDSDMCCFDLSVSGLNGSEVIASISAQLNSTQVKFIGVIAPPGWTSTNSGAYVTWTPTSGSAATASGLRFCLYSLIDPPQTMELTIHLTDGRTCTRTISVECPKSPPPFLICAPAEVHAVECERTGPSGSVYSLSMSVVNNSMFSDPFGYDLPAENLEIHGLNGATITPNNVTFPPLGFGATSAPLSFTVTAPGASAGDQVCFIYRLKGGQDPINPCCYQWCCPWDTICITLPECKDCCEGFLLGAQIASPPTYNGQTLSTVPLLLTAGPAPISSVTVSVVAAQAKSYCKKPNNTWAVVDWHPIGAAIATPLPATIGGGSGLPYVTPPTPFGAAPPGPYAEATWGVVPTGVPFGGIALSIPLEMTPPPSLTGGLTLEQRCFDSVRVCLRVRYTDSACRVCDTMICYTQRRVRSLFKNVPERREADLTAIPFGELPPRPGLDVSPWVTIRMESRTNGRLRIALPSILPELEAEGGFRVVGFRLQPEAGVSIASLEGARLGDNGAERSTNLGPGDDSSYPIAFDIKGQDTKKTIDNTLTLFVVNNATPGDTLRIEHRVTANYGAMEGDNGKLVQVVERSRPLMFLATVNVTDLSEEEGILTHSMTALRVRAPQGVRLLAAGMPADSSSMLFRAYQAECATCSTQVGLRPAPPETGVEIDLEPDTTYEIVVVVEPNGRDSATLEYEALNADGEVIATGTFDVDLKTSSIREDEVPNVTLHMLDVNPNPTTGLSDLAFDLDTPGLVTLDVRDLHGRTVMTVIDAEHLEAGGHNRSLVTAMLPSGSYFLVLRADGAVSSRRFEVLH